MKEALWFGDEKIYFSIPIEACYFYFHYLFG